MQKASTQYGLTQICAYKWLGFMQSFSNILETTCVWNQRHRSNILSTRSNKATYDVVQTYVTSNFKKTRINKLKQSGLLQHVLLYLTPQATNKAKFVKMWWLHFWNCIRWWRD